MSLLAKNRWPFRLDATYDETITRALNVYEEVNREIPLQGLHWFIDPEETISQRNMERIQAMGGGIAIQSRMAELASRVEAGTVATRVASYNPFVSHWLVTGKMVGGLAMRPDGDRRDRMEAPRLWTVGSSGSSGDDGKKGAIVPGQRAYLAVLPADISPCRKGSSNLSNRSLCWAF